MLTVSLFLLLWYLFVTSWRSLRLRHHCWCRQWLGQVQYTNWEWDLQTEYPPWLTSYFVIFLKILYFMWKGSRMIIRAALWRTEALKIMPWLRLCMSHKVRLHGTRQAVRLAHDMLQHDLLRSNSGYMVGSCRAWLLHINHVLAVFEAGVLERKLGHLLAIACAARQF